MLINLIINFKVRFDTVQTLNAREEGEGFFKSHKKF